MEFLLHMALKYNIEAVAELLHLQIGTYQWLITFQTNLNLLKSPFMNSYPKCCNNKQNVSIYVLFYWIAYRIKTDSCLGQ